MSGAAARSCTLVGGTDRIGSVRSDVRDHRRLVCLVPCVRRYLRRGSQEAQRSVHLLRLRQARSSRHAHDRLVAAASPCTAADASIGRLRAAAGNHCSIAVTPTDWPIDRPTNRCIPLHSTSLPLPLHLPRCVTQPCSIGLGRFVMYSIPFHSHLINNNIYVPQKPLEPTARSAYAASHRITSYRIDRANRVRRSSKSSREQATGARPPRPTSP